MDTSALLQKLNDGDVSNIVPEVKAALAGRGHSSFAHRAIVRISNLCIKSSSRADPVIKDDDEALQLVLFCVQAIDVDAAHDSDIPANYRTMAAVCNVLTRFHGNSNTACVVKTMSAFLPVVEKMLSSMGEQEHKSLSKYVILIQNVLLSVSNSMYKEDPNNEISLLALWDLMLRVCSLVSAEKSIISIVFVMRSMLGKYENCHGSSNTEKVLYFNSILLEKFITFSETKLAKLADEDIASKFFNMFVPTLWNFLRPIIKSGSISNSCKTVSCMSKFVESFLSAHPHYIECFKLITRILKTFLFQDEHSSEEIYFINELQYFMSILEENKIKGVSPAFMWVIFIAGCVVTSFDKVTTEIQTKRPFFTTELLVAFHHFTKLLSELLVSCNNAVCQAANGQICPYKGDAALAFKTVSIFVTLSMDHKKDNKEERTALLPLIQSSFACQQSILNKAVEGMCVKADLLKESLCDTYYRLGNLCYNTNNWDYGQMFLKQPLKFLYTDKDMSSTQIQLVFSLLSRLAVCCEKQELREEAKVSALLHVILHLKCGTPQHPFICDQWALLQNADPTNAKTAEEFLKHKSLLLKSMCPEFSFDSKLVPGLLLWELSCYVIHRMKSSDLILKTWLALKASKASPLMLLEGSAMACQALFSCSDKVNWYDLISDSLLTWFSQVKESEKAVSLCLLAVHYQIKFLMEAQKHFDENEFKVEEVSVYTHNPALVRQPQDVINPADICQVASTFPNLNIQREQKLMDLLDTAINYWNDSLKAGLCSDHHAMHPAVTASGEYLLQIGFHYTLWGYHTGAAKTFQLCCKFAKKMSLDDLWLQALSGLMNIVEVKRELIVEADALLARLKDHHKISYLTKFYHTSRAFQALRTNAYAEGVKVLQKVMDCTPTSSSLWCYAYTKLLQASYSLLPKSKVDKTQLGGSQSAHLGLVYCILTIQDKRLSCSPLIFAAIVNQALSASLWIGRYYARRQMPKQARCYLKPELMLALKLGLATRAAEFICELAFVDLLTEKVDEASAKIVDLQCILGNSETSSDNNSGHGDAIEEFNEACSRQPVPSSKSPDSNLGASPHLERNEVFHLPITHHDSFCKCYMCRNYSVQNIWLMYSHLQAKINVLRFDVHKSFDIYMKAFRAAGLVLSKLSQPSCSTGILLQQHQIACTEICLRLDFVDMLVMYGKDTEALKRNSGILEGFKTLKTDENQLFGDALEQKMCIVNIIEQKGKKETGSGALKTPAACDSQQTSPKIFVEKTPEQSACIITPHMAGKKRQPLKPVKTPNQLLVPLTEQQFFTPKANLNIGRLIDSDDEEQTSQTSKENVSSAHPKFSETKTNKSEGNKNIARSLGGQETEKTKEKAEGKNNASSKLPKSTRGAKAKAGEVSVCDEPEALKKVASTRRAATSVDKVITSKKSSGTKATETTNVASGDKFVVPQKTARTRNVVNPVVSQKAASVKATVTNARQTSSRSNLKSSITKLDLECSSSGENNGKAASAVGLKMRKEAASKTESHVPAKSSIEAPRQTRQRKT